MKRSRRITTILVMCTMATVLFAGCGSKTASVATTNRQAGMKTTYTNILKALVADKTITQDQSDKVLAELTKNPGTKPSGTKPADGAQSSGTKSKNNRLSALVTAGAITQVQADTTNQKIIDAMKSAKDSPNTQSTQNN